MELKEIRDIRKKLSLTQQQLAQHAGVSQSLIAKVEAGILDPTYSNAQKIFSALGNLGQKHELKASQIMNHSVISVSPSTPIKEAISKMKKQGFSQLVVLHHDSVLGMVSESSVLDAILNGRGKNVEDIMEAAPPVVAPESSADVIAHLLKYFQLVLVSNKGKLAGVVTKADLLAKLYGKS